MGLLEWQPLDIERASCPCGGCGGDREEDASAASINAWCSGPGHRLIDGARIVSSSCHRNVYHRKHSETHRDGCGLAQNDKRTELNKARKGYCRFQMRVFT